MYNFRTDLASERREIYQKANHLENEVPGIQTEEMQEGENIKITKVKIIDEQGAHAIRKANWKLYYH